MYIRTTTEDKSGTVTAYMTQTDHDQLMADAKLGAMVRKLPINTYLHHSKNSGWQVYQGAGGSPVHPYLKPLANLFLDIEAALLAAGIEEE